MEIVESFFILLAILAVVAGPIALLLGLLRLLRLTGRDPVSGRRLAWRALLFSGLTICLLTTTVLVTYRDTYNSQAPPRKPIILGRKSESKQKSLERGIREYKVVEVFYATDRGATGLKEPSLHYGTRRFGKINWGTCRVSIPGGHRIGKLEAPRLLLLEFSSDPAKHVVLLEVRPLKIGQFGNLLRRRLAKAPDSEALVFIHGFNVTFEDAARRTAQLASDLGQEIPIFYSWPSKGREASYSADEATIEWTIPHLMEFLRVVTQVAGSKRINVVAHSMGNRALLRALQLHAQGQPKGKFRNLVLTAPDIDADTFQDLAREFSGLAERATLYASARDKAIEISRRLHEAPRAGDAAGDLVIVDGVDTIDATLVNTDFLAHSYYGDSRTVVSDLYYLVRGLPPAKRHGLRERWRAGRKYWSFQP